VRSKDVPAYDYFVDRGVAGHRLVMVWSFDQAAAHLKAGV
jgi:hypothetical protein